MQQIFQPRYRSLQARYLLTATPAYKHTYAHTATAAAAVKVKRERLVGIIWSFRDELFVTRTFFWC